MEVPQNSTAGDRPEPVSRRYSTLSTIRLDKLKELEKKVDKINSKIEGFKEAVTGGTASPAQLSLVQDALAQCYGDLEKLQYTEIDSVITGDLSTGKADAKTLRKSLSKRTGNMLTIVAQLVEKIKSRRRAEREQSKGEES